MQFPADFTLKKLLNLPRFCIEIGTPKEFLNSPKEILNTPKENPITPKVINSIVHLSLGEDFRCQGHQVLPQ